MTEILRRGLRLRWTRVLSGLLVAVCGGELVSGQVAPTLTVVGAANGQVRFVAEAAAVAVNVPIQSAAEQPVTASLQVGPFRDAAGRLYPAAVSILQAASGVQASAETAQEVKSSSLPSHPLTFPPMGALAVRIEATLAAEGEYTSDVVLVQGKQRDQLRVIVTRASRVLSVEIHGLDAVHGTASVGKPSVGELRLLLLETLGSDVELNPIVLTKLTRKAPDGGQTQAPYQLRIDGNPAAPLRLTRNQPRSVVLGLEGLPGAGDYAGTVRVSAAGAKPVDQPFTLNLREPRGIALAAIFLGVLLSTLMRWLAQSFRPRLVDLRRTHLLSRELAELLADPARQPEESVVLRVLRRELVGIQIALDVGGATNATSALDLLELRRKLAVDWIQRRRQVEALRPASIRERFRAVVGGARDTILSQNATTEQVKAAHTTLSGLNTAIDTALQDELSVRIAELRKSLDALTARPASQLAVLAPAALRGLLDEAEREKKNLARALELYDQAQRAWTSFLLDDLAAVADAPAPLGLTGDQWGALAERLKADLAAAQMVLADDPEAAVRRYNGALAQYVATVSDGLRRALDGLRARIAEKADDDQQKAAVAMVDEAAAAIAQARTELSGGRVQAAAGFLTMALERAAAAGRSITRSNRSALSTDAPTTSATVLHPAPVLADSRSPDLIASDRALGAASRAIDRVDLFMFAIAASVATILGVTVLWTPNPSWGGWDDRIVAILWGLGVHQFTFAGLPGLADRLRGTQPAGGQS